jgi:hypothetical protein
LLDSRHRSLFEGQLAALDEQASDRLVGVTVLVGVGQPHRAAVRKPDASRTLHLQKEQFNRIVDIEQDPVGVVLLMTGDFRARK